MDGQDIEVRATGGAYPVIVRAGAVRGLGALAAERVKGRTALVVTDSNVAPLHLPAVVSSLQSVGFAVSEHIVPAGEESKDLANLSALWDAMHGAGVTRSDLVVALGGGVVGDLTGFAAATWLRGVAVMQVPTSLLAFVDSAIGGKTAIDLPFGKNLAGAFHQPVAVLGDPLLLRTLPGREFRQGMAEVVKCGCILDADFFSFLESLPPGGPASEPDLVRVVRTCAAMKADVVSRDEREGGLRMLLNFGHTVGHAIEKVLGYGTVAHGEAVAAGMVAAARVGEALGVTACGVADRIAALLRRLSLPVEVSECGAAATDAGAIFPAMLSDKKKIGGEIRFVALERIGASRVVPLAPEALRPLVAAVLR